MEHCIFCQIIAGQAPASRVYQDEIVTVFMDIRPVNPGHVLVIPNRHAASLSALDETSGAQIFRVGQRMAAALYHSGLPCEGVNFFLADGTAAGQEVYHVHLHVFPRFANDGFGLRFSPAYYQKSPAREDLDRVAKAIQAGLSDQPRSG